MVVKALGRHVCPICGFQSSRGDLLVRHVVLEHLPKTGEKGFGGSPFFRCWCSWSSNHTHGASFRRHFKNHGGLVAHYLEHHLGVADGKS